MTPDSSPASSPRATPRKPGGPLDGEVIPPKIRVLNPEPAAPPTADTGRQPFGLRLSTVLLAGALLATLSGTAALEGYRWHLRHMRVAAGPSSTALALARFSQEVSDLKASVAAARAQDPAKAFEKSVDQLRADLSALRAANAAAVAQLSTRLDAKATATPMAPVLTDVVARLDKLDHDPRLGDIASRLDRIEHQVSSPAPTGSITKAQATTGQSVVAQTAPAAPLKPVKMAVLDNWVVRDVYSGIALVEGRSGSVREIVPGETLPGAGEVQSIQRRGRAWIVVTSRGIIDTATW